MADLRDVLIRLYASGRPDQVHTQDEYRGLCEQHEGNSAFYRERALVNELREYVDEHVGRHAASRMQVEHSLRLVRRLKHREKQQITRELVLRSSYGEAWSAPQRSTFESRAAFIERAQHYFLSFTTRHPAGTPFNTLNREHKFFIIHALGWDRYEDADLDSDNLLAEAVHATLSSRRLDGFFFPDRKFESKVIEDKLRDECGRSLAFVQVMDGEIFEYDPNRRNWCHFEYELAKVGVPDHLHFIRAEERFNAAGIFPGFERWYRDFEGRDAVVLETTRRYATGRIDDNHERIFGKLADLVLQAEDKLYSGIPD